MSHQRRIPGRLDLDTAFKAFGAIAIAIAVVLTVSVLAVTDPLGAFVTATPAALGTVLFTGLLLVVGYAAYVLRRE